MWINCWRRADCHENLFDKHQLWAHSNSFYRQIDLEKINRLLFLNKAYFRHFCEFLCMLLWYGVSVYVMEAKKNTDTKQIREARQWTNNLSILWVRVEMFRHHAPHKRTHATHWSQVKNVMKLKVPITN